MFPAALYLEVWELSSTTQGDAVKLFKVIDIDRQKQLYEHMKTLTPLPSIYLPEIITEDNADMAGKVLAGTKSELVDQVREQIRDFNAAIELEKGSRRTVFSIRTPSAP